MFLALREELRKLTLASRLQKIRFSILFRREYKGFFVEETGVSEVKNTDLPQVTDRETLSHNVVSSTPHLDWIRTYNLSGDMHWLHR